MAREHIENWHVKKCATCCQQCGEAFTDRQMLESCLFFAAGEYTRQDYCIPCAQPSALALSAWKTVFMRPPPPEEETVKKETVESLLRKLLTQEKNADLNAIFILTIMLERKKILVERDIQHMEDGRRLRLYEHKKTGESFMIIDPALRLDQLEPVQEAVVVLLGGQARSAESSEIHAGRASESA